MTATLGCRRHAPVIPPACSSPCVDLDSPPPSFPVDARVANSSCTPRELRQRFDGLPIHRICHDHSHLPSSVVLRRLRAMVSPTGPRRIRRMCDRTIATGNEWDGFGMTPLHILACCDRHDVELYRIIVDGYPENVIAGDAWGDVPVLHALRGNAPDEVIRLFLEREQQMFPQREIDWTSLVERLGRALHVRGTSSPLSCVRRLLAVQRDVFPSHGIDWQSALTRWAAEDTDSANRCHIKKFHQETFKYLVQVSVKPRLEGLGIDRWRRNVLREVDDGLCWFILYRKKSTESVYSKLALYERLNELREASTILELALWKGRIDDVLCDDPARRAERRVRCGADVVVPNVLSFLLPRTDEMAEISRCPSTSSLSSLRG